MSWRRREISVAYGEWGMNDAAALGFHSGGGDLRAILRKVRCVTPFLRIAAPLP
jgi:hypothetical protein